MFQDNSKKTIIALIISIIVVVIAIIITCIFIFGKPAKSSAEQLDDKVKPITYYDPSTVDVTDKLALTIEEKADDGKGIMFGFSGEGVAENLKFNSNSYIELENDIISISDYKINEKITLTYNDIYFIFDYCTKYYKPTETGEYLEDCLIVYKDKNFILTQTFSDSYQLHYVINTDVYNRNIDGARHWGVIDISFHNTIEEAKERIKEINKYVDIYVYDKQDGYKNSSTNNYKHIYDVCIDSLMDYGLYIDSYKTINSINQSNIHLENSINLADSNNKTVEFHIFSYASIIDEEDFKETLTLNGKKLKFTSTDYSFYTQLENKNDETNIIKLQIKEKSFKNVPKALKETFSKN